jgi:hypothetical protein
MDEERVGPSKVYMDEERVGQSMHMIKNELALMWQSKNFFTL